MERFRTGQAAGPGRPRGSRNKSAVLFDEIGSEGVAELIRSVKERADKGDMRAAAILLARTWPRRRGRAVEIELPPVETSAGLIQAQAALIAALARGEITPDEAASVACVLETQRRAIETHDHTRRIRALENQKPEPERRPEDDEP